MNLGEKIYNYRKAKNISQDELAETLDVSRQSVSKWENNISTPEIDKIKKLADYFEISLDEFLNDEKTDVKENKIKNGVNKDARWIVRICSGVFLGCISILLAILGFILSFSFNYFWLIVFPFLFCSIICFTFRKRVILFCGWAVFFLIDMFIRLNSGNHWGCILGTFNSNSNLDNGQLTLVWIQILSLVILISATVYSFGKKSFFDIKKQSKKTITFGIISISLWIFVRIFYFILDILYFNNWNMEAWSIIFRISYPIFDWSRALIATIFLVNLVRYIKLKRNI